MHPALMTPGQVADLFGVEPKTISRWARLGKLPYVTTIGGHRRYPADAVQALARSLGIDTPVA